MGGRKSTPQPPQLQAPKKIAYGTTFGEFTGQLGYLPSLEEAAGRINLGFQQQLEKGLPGTLAATAQTSNLVNQFLTGAPSADVQAAAQRQLAERNILAGLPATSQAAIFGEAASFGRTSMDIQQQGLSMVPGLTQLAEFLNPQQAQNYLFSTGQIRAEELKAEQDRVNVANQNAINKYNYDLQKSQQNSGLFGSIGGLVGGLGGAALGSYVPGIGTALGASLGSALGGATGSFAGGGSFAPTGMAGSFGQMFGQLGPEVFGAPAAKTSAAPSSGAFGGGGGGSFMSYAAPFTMADMQMKPSSPGGFGGMNNYSYSPMFPTNF